MKLKGISKLVLAGTALAATAATLTTATYAWYVSNAEVTATGVQGQVKSNADGSLYIAQNKIIDEINTPDKYKTTLTLLPAAAATRDDDLAAGKFQADELEPQSLYRGATTYKYTAYTGNAVQGETYYERGADTYSATSDTKVQPRKTYYEKTGTDTYAVKTGLVENADIAANSLYERTENYTAIETGITVGSPVPADSYKREEDLVQNKSWVDADGKKVEGKFISFKYWLKSSAAGTVTFKLTVDNITGSPSGLSQQAFRSEGLPNGVGQGGAFIADAVHALRMNVTQTAYEAQVSHAKDTYTEITAQSDNKTYVAGTTYYKTKTPTYELTSDKYFQASKTYYSDTNGTEATVTSGTKITGTYYEKVEFEIVTAQDIKTLNNLGENEEITSASSVVGYYTKTAGAADTKYEAGASTPNDYKLDKIALGVTGANYVTAGSTAASAITFAEGGDANVYYYNVLDESAYNTAVGVGTSEVTATGLEAWQTMTLAADTDTLFEFKVWLEGSDADCWDSCKGQSFKFDFDIEFQKTNS